MERTTRSICRQQPRTHRNTIERKPTNGDHQTSYTFQAALEKLTNILRNNTNKWPMD